MKKSDLREKIHLTSVDELFGLENAESSIEIAIDRIRSFKDHPFKVQDDDKMADLVESIKANGVLTPVLVRGNDGDGYEMISGHRRLHASKLAGLKKIPAFVRELWSAVLFLDTPAIPYVYLIMLFMQLLFHHIYANILSVSCISTLNGDAFDYKTSQYTKIHLFSPLPL